MRNHINQNFVPAYQKAVNIIKNASVSILKSANFADSVYNEVKILYPIIKEDKKVIIPDKAGRGHAVTLNGGGIATEATHFITCSVPFEGNIDVIREAILGIHEHKAEINSKGIFYYEYVSHVDSHGVQAKLKENFLEYIEKVSKALESYKNYFTEQDSTLKKFIEEGVQAEIKNREDDDSTLKALNNFS
jgi:hypothetical protein